MDMQKEARRTLTKMIDLFFKNDLASVHKPITKSGSKGLLNTTSQLRYAAGEIGRSNNSNPNYVVTNLVVTKLRRYKDSWYKGMASCKNLF